MKKLFGRDWNQRLEGARQIAEQNAPTNVAGLLDVQEKINTAKDYFSYNPNYPCPTSRKIDEDVSNNDKKSIESL